MSFAAERQIDLDVPEMNDVRPWLSYSLSGDVVHRHVHRRNGKMSTSSLRRIAWSSDLAADFDLSWLRAGAPAELSDASRNAPSIKIADLFAGCGGMSLGLREAARALAMKAEFVLGAEMDPVKAEVYRGNFSPNTLWTDPVETLLDGALGERATPRERKALESIGEVDVLVGGPPCQGHSDLNNHTRRDDVRNGLISRMARAAELLRPAHVVVENVQGVRHDRGGAAATTATYLRNLGYEVEDGVVEFDRLGVPQTRRRYLLVASRTNSPDLRATVEAVATSRRTVGWALSDLLEVDRSDTANTSAVHSRENQRRMHYLFENDLHDLPNAERPDCHRFKTHTYNSVYGRMWWDDCAPTITTGFGSTGQGRFVHPKFPRTLTPREAARLQTVPDTFDFGGAGRTQLQKMIGNMVPPLAMTALCIGLLR